jgi:hypothetical protein
MTPVFFKSDGRARSPGKCMDINALQKHIGKSPCQQILVLHAFGGCDTTSAIFMHGKGKFMSLLSQTSKLLNM